MKFKQMLLKNKLLTSFVGGILSVVVLLVSIALYQAFPDVVGAVMTLMLLVPLFGALIYLFLTWHDPL